MFKDNTVPEDRKHEAPGEKAEGEGEISCTGEYIHCKGKDLFYKRKIIIPPPHDGFTLLIISIIIF